MAFRMAFRMETTYGFHSRSYDESVAELELTGRGEFTERSDGTAGVASERKSLEHSPYILQPDRSIGCHRVGHRPVLTP